MSAAHLRDPARRALFRRGALAKGLELARQLEQLMSGLDVRLEDLGPGAPPRSAADKIAKLRAYLARVDRVVKSFATDTYGPCAECREIIDETRLLETPWTDVCARCWNAALTRRST